MANLAIAVNGTTPASVLQPKPDRRRAANPLFLRVESSSSLYARINVLVAGPEAVTEAFLRTVTPSIPGPIIDMARDAPFVLPNLKCTLVLRDVDALSETEQEMLSRWLEDDPHGTRHVISVTTIPLHERVLAGAFNSALYYRLNVIYLDFTASLPGRAG